MRVHGISDPVAVTESTIALRVRRILVDIAQRNDPRLR
jgi:hypothetical protein